MSLKIGAFNSNYRCECPNINEGFVFFGWRILFSDLAVLQNAALLSCPRGAGSVASRFANGAMPCASCRCFRVRADDGLYMAAALQNAALLSCPRERAAWRVVLRTALCRAHRAAVLGYGRTMGCIWQQRCRLQRC